MEAVQAEVSQFQREYLWELQYAEKQIMQIAEAIPAESYGWRPAKDARSFTEPLAHIAAACMMLIYRAELYTPEVTAFCGNPAGEGMAKWVTMAHNGLALEKTLVEKQSVIDALKRAFHEVRQTFLDVPEKDMETVRDFGGEVTTVRRIYLRILTHCHEHMGQVVGYSRMMGFAVPWPDPIRVMEQMAASKTA